MPGEMIRLVSKRLAPIIICSCDLPISTIWRFEALIDRLSAILLNSLRLSGMYTLGNI